MSVFAVFLEVKNSPVALRLIEHEDKIAVLKDVFHFAACQEVFDVLRDSGRYAAPFPKPFPNFDGIGCRLFLFQEQVKLVHVVARRLFLCPVDRYAVPYLVLHNEHMLRSRTAILRV